MKSRLTITLAACLALTSSVLATDRNPASRPPRGAPHVLDELLLRWRQGTQDSSIAAAHAEVGAKEMLRFANVEGLTLVKLAPDVSVTGALERYRNRPDVMYAEPSYYRYLQTVPNDPYFANGSLWGLQNTGQGGGTLGADIHATAAWNLTTGSRSVAVVVIDTGIDYKHQDLAANMWPKLGINTVPNGNSNDPMDDTVGSHGTRVAGVLGAVGNNKVGVVGVNWRVSLIACKAFDSNFKGSDGTIIACLNYAQTLKQQGVNIVATVAAWGGAPPSQALYDAIAAQMKAGILFVTAAGNNPIDQDIDGVNLYPADFDLSNIIAVSGTDRNDNLYYYSGYGAHEIHLGAPGQDIYSTVRGNGYDIESGTSLATAYVAGVAALLKAQDASRDWRAIKNLILAGGDTIPALSNITITGKRLNAYGSLVCQNSTVVSRFRPRGDGWTAVNIPMGTRVDVSVLNIKCAHPHGPVNIRVKPGNVVLALVDDGTHGDQAAGDGVYSGQWVPDSVGSYTLTFPGDDTWQANVIPVYTYSVVPFKWRTIAGTNLNLCDDCTAAITPPFAINLGGVSFSSLYVDSNGKLNFLFPESDPLNVFLPNTYEGYSFLVAAFWDDLLPIQNTAQNVFWTVAGTAPQRELVIEWRNVSRASGCMDAAATVDFEVVFFERSNNVLFNYARTTFGGPPACALGDRGAHATAGIQLTYPSAAQYSYDQPNLTDKLSLQFTLVP